MTQTQALTVMKMGHSVLLTGAAGSGKTYTLNQFIAWLKQHNIKVAVTASTGIAATHLGGQTIHSWSGVGIKDFLDSSDLRRLESRADILKRFSRTSVLIIDEVSMVSAQLLDNVDQVLRHVLDVDLPFGGLQVILSGDLFQLPPVSRNGAVQTAVESQAFSDLGPVICYLSEQHRQADTDPLVDILNAVRSAEIDDYHTEHLTNRPQEAPVGVTRLHSHNAAVDTINQESLSKIDTSAEIFNMTSRGRKNLVEGLIQSCLAPEILELKVGAEVMFVKNEPSGRYVNGTRGIVRKFAQTGEPIVETRDGRTLRVEMATWSLMDESGREVAAIDQLPLRLAWAITIHKSQGMSLDEVHMDLSNVFEYGMGYVALSRAKSMDGLYIAGLNNKALAVNPKVSQIDAQLRRHAEKTAERVSDLDDQKTKQLINEAIVKRGGEVDPKRAATKRVAESTKGSKDSFMVTIDLLRSNTDLSLKDAAKKRELKTQTIVAHLARYVEENPAQASDFARFKPESSVIKKVHSKTAQTKRKEGLKVLRDWLKSKHDLSVGYDNLHLALAWPVKEVKK